MEGQVRLGAIINSVAKAPLGSKKTALAYPGQIMKMRTPGDFVFSAFVGDIPEGMELRRNTPPRQSGPEISIKCQLSPLIKRLKLIIFHAK